MHKSGFVPPQYATLQTKKVQLHVMQNYKKSKQRNKGSEHQTSTRLTVLTVSQQDISRTIWFIVLSITQHRLVTLRR